MSENEEAKPAQQDNGGIVLDLNLSFAPSWARTSPDANIQRYRDERFDGGEGGEGRHGGRDGGRDRRPPQRNFDDRDRRKPDRRPPRKEFDGAPPRAVGTDMPRPESRAAVADLRGPRPESAFRPDSGPRQDRGGERRDFRAPRPEFPPLPIEIRVLPEQKALGAVIRRIQTSHRAFPLRDIAWLFLDNPASCLIRIEPLKDQQLPLFQCKVCGLPALTEEEIRAHLVNRHMDDFFDVEEVDCDPPAGAFVCVARCGLSGVLLGPPNHHSFNSKVNEMLRTKYPSMTEEAYRSRIETVRTPEAIEQWRQQCTRKNIYRRKGATPTAVEPVADAGEAAAEGAESEPAPKAPPMERDIAELVFMREILPEQISSVRHLICTAAVAIQTSSRPLFFALKDTLNRERRFPASLFFALRGAFRHRNLHLFRVNDPKGQDFVMLKAPLVLEPTHAVQALRDVLTYVNEHAACTKAELAAALAGADEAKMKETLVQLAWLVEKGHVIEYYNDVLSAPIDYPAFRFLQSEKQSGGQQGGAPHQPQAVRRAAPSAAPASEAGAVSAVQPPAATGDPVAVATAPDETDAAAAFAADAAVEGVPETSEPTCEAETLVTPVEEKQPESVE